MQRISEWRSHLRSSTGPARRAKTHAFDGGRCCKNMIRSIVVLSILLQGCASITDRTCSGVYSLEDMGWYERKMKAAGARPLCSTDSPRIERYRLIWLRTFHNPIIVTLTRTDREIELVGVRLDGAGGYQLGRVAERKHVALPYTEFAEFGSYLEQMDFWRLKSRDELIKGVRDARTNLEEIVVSTDGAQWILEGADANRAHSADRWSDADGPFQDAALFLLRKSGINLNGPVY